MPAKLVNCYLEPREDQEGFMFMDDLPNLDGYAIIPIERYERLSGLKTGLVPGTVLGES